MRIVRKSISRKLFIYLLLFALLVSSIAFYFYYREEKDVPYLYFLIVLGVFVLFFLAAYYWDVFRPMKRVLGEMQSLIAGKPYKRIYTDRIDEIGVIAHFFNQVTKGLGEVSHDIKDRERILDELSIASQLQRDILPTESPAISGLYVCAKNRPATEVGGDCFDFVSAKGKTYIYLGDVTGHGVAAGLIMTMVNSLIEVFANIYDSAYEILVNVNWYIKAHVKKAMFMTLVMLSWDEEAQLLTFVGAGHEHILVYRGKTGSCDVILSGGVALGMVPDNSEVIKEQKIDMDVGDYIVLYSDGIIEARNSAGEMFGLERLTKLFEDFAPQYSAEGINYHIAKEVSAFVVGTDQLDDMTLIVIERKPGGSVVSAPQDNTTNWNA